MTRRIHIAAVVALLVGLAGRPAWAQVKETSQTFGPLTTAGACARMDLAGYGTASIEISQISGGVTVTFYSSNSGNLTASQTLNMTRANASSQVTSTTTVGVFKADITSYRYLHACTSGTGSVSGVMSASSASQGVSNGGGAGGGGSLTILDGVGGVNLAQVNGSSQLSVVCANCSGSGVSQVDTTGFTPTTTVFVPVGGEVDEISTATLSEGQAGAARLTAQRSLEVNLRNNGGTETGTASNPFRTDPTGSTPQPITDNGGSLTIDAPVGTPAFVRLSDGVNPITTLAVSLASVPSHAVTNAGTFAVQESGAALTALQLIDNLPNTIGSVTSGQSGLLTFCATSTSAPTNTNGQSNPFSCDTSGAIRVTGSSGTTQYNEDTASADAQSIVAVGFVRRDTTPTVSSGTAGDWTFGNIDANGRIYTQTVVYNSSGTEQTFATDKTTDAALATPDTGPLQICRGSTATPTAMSTDNDATAIWCDLNGRTIVGGSYLEDAAHTSGDRGLAILGVRSDTTPSSTAGTAGDYTLLNLDANGRLYTNTTIYNASGTAQNLATDQTEDAASVGGETGPMVLTVRRDTAASSAGTSGDFATFNTDVNGLLWARNADPCTGLAATTVAISQTADTQVITGTASKKTYICSMLINANGAETVGLVEGTGTTCATGTTAIIGSTTDANSVGLAANGGWVAARTISGSGTNVNTCLMVSTGGVRVSGYLTYVQQ